MAKYENYYENLQEAQMRLRSTVVLYDKDPMYIWGVTDHMGDGVFRVYMTPVEEVRNDPGGSPLNHISSGHASLGPALDQWMTSPQVKAATNFHILRKKMNSPSFNRFRPFPLGMVNGPTQAMYVERQPQRPKTEQGLTSGGLFASPITASQGKTGRPPVDMFTKEFRDCVIGDYPSPKTVLEGLRSPKFMNESVAFHRKFALVRGPIDILFLAYKSDVIGVLPDGDFSKLRLGKEYKHCKEVVDELNLFVNIQ